MAVIALVSQDLAGAQGVDQGQRLGAVVHLARRKDEADGGVPRRQRPRGSWCSVRLGNASEPSSGAPFSGRRLLVRPDDGAVNHQLFVVAIFDQVGEDLIKDAFGRPARETLRDGLELAVPVGLVGPARPGSLALPGSRCSRCAHWAVVSS